VNTTDAVVPPAVLTPEAMNRLHHVLDEVLGHVQKGHGRTILTIRGTTLDGRTFSGFLWLDVRADL
jgi:hypothetical protein